MTPIPTEFPVGFETKRLVLRCYQQGDGPMYYQVSRKNKDHLQQFESGNALLGIHNEPDGEAVIHDFITCWETRKAFFLGAFMKENHEFAAQVYIGVVSQELPEFEIGYFVDAEHEGKGLVTEAVRGALDFIFNQLGAHRVRLECDETNLRSIRVAERCGFKREGLVRETKKNPDGRFTGDLHYGLLREEYFAEIHTKNSLKAADHRRI